MQIKTYPVGILGITGLEEKVEPSKRESKSNEMTFKHTLFAWYCYMLGIQI